MNNKEINAAMFLISQFSIAYFVSTSVNHQVMCDQIVPRVIVLSAHLDKPMIYELQQTCVI